MSGLSTDTSILKNIGSELDAARRSRNHTGKGETTTAYKATAGHSATVEEESLPERPYPLCLLCLIRPPSAVLLPCCHLNICHVCAPLLFLKCKPVLRPTLEDEDPHSSSSTASTVGNPSHTNPSGSTGPELASSSSSPRPTATTQATTRPPPPVEDETPRVSWNTILMRATANHPKSRRLSLGGYLPPPMGMKGGEMGTTDILPPLRGPRPSTASVFVNPCVDDLSGHIPLSSSPAVEAASGDESSLDPSSAQSKTTHQHTRDSRSGLESTLEQDGRIKLSSISEDEPPAAKCMICRAGVQGWLRVYAG